MQKKKDKVELTCKISPEKIQTFFKKKTACFYNRKNEKPRIIKGK